MTKRRFGVWRWPALLVVLALVLAACDWPMYRFGPAHTGHNSGETKIGVGNVASLQRRFVAPTGGMYFDSSPAVANGVVYTGSGLAFDANGVAGCSGTPKTCAPLWINQSGTTGDIPASPAVANGVVYLSSEGGNLLEAYDASGVTGCSGSPKICSPLWTSTIGSGAHSSPTVANGVVYVAGLGDLYAYDAKGVAGCSGTPKTCSPLWTAGIGGTWDSSPAVANGIVYIGSTGSLQAFDANGMTGCSGTPKVCDPLWESDYLGSGSEYEGSPAVANGIVYHDGAAYDANGVAGCSGTPKTCSPLWLFPGGDGSSPAVANGVVYVGNGWGMRVLAFDASGTTGCSGIPKTCAPLWRSAAARDRVRSSPSVANGVLYIGTNDWNAYAFDASGTTGCSGIPKTCAPLWTFNTGGNVWSSPAIANGRVYIGSSGGLYAFGLP